MIDEVCYREGGEEKKKIENEPLVEVTDVEREKVGRSS